MKDFYQMTPQEVKLAVNGSDVPLTEEQVKDHQDRYGKNELAEGKKKSIAQIFLEQFKDFLVIILIGAAAVSGVLGDFRYGSDRESRAVAGQFEKNVGAGS